jgi:hypothetical protein
VTTERKRTEEVVATELREAYSTVGGGDGGGTARNVGVCEERK